MSIAFKLRPAQQRLISGIETAWSSGATNVCAVAPTGFGKTVTFSAIVERMSAPTCLIAHRQELVSQISLALARSGVRHSIVAPPAVVRTICQLHQYELGRQWYEPNAKVRVAGVGTLVRHNPSDPWLKQVALWVLDEAHHGTVGTQWHKAIQMFPHARGLGMTATPTRADGKGLGRHADGFFDALVLGPSLREVIAEGHLTEYRIFAPPAAALDLAAVPVSAGGDWSPEPLRAAVHKASITGDVVRHYLRHAAGKRGITFAVDIEAAGELAAAYRAAGVPAECVSGKTPDMLRAQILRKLRTGEILQVTNCDLFGEGFDLPAIESVSMARPTQSFGLFVQQAGRGLRLMEGKDRALLIDHVGNVQRHAVARWDDAAGRTVVDLCYRNWTLDRRDRKASNKSTDAIPTRVCPGCTQPYERSLVACPYCGHAVEPAGRSAPEQVDGDLHELDPTALRGLVARVQQVNAPTIVPPQGLSGPALGALNKRHAERLEAQQALQDAMARWGGIGRRLGREREGQKEFFLRFGVDVLTAQTLGASEARDLEARVRQDLC